MSKITKRLNKAQLQARIYKQLKFQPEQQTKQQSQSHEDIGYGRKSKRGIDPESQKISDDLDRIMRQNQRKKQRLRNELSKGKLDFTEQMNSLKWRIDCLKTNHNKATQNSFEGKTFDQLYQMQKKKYSALRERRKNKVNDPNYLEMIGNSQLRREKRKIAGLGRIQDHLKLLDQQIES